MKKLLSTILATILLLSCFISLAIGAEGVITVTIDGVVQDYNVNPVIVDGRTLVPMRAVFESLGAEVDWNGETRTVTGKTDKTEVILVIDNKEAKVNGNEVVLDVPAQLVGSSTMVPARFIADAFGYDVDWNAETKTVVITKNESKLYSVEALEWQKRVIGRARQMTDITYTPVRDIPTYVASKQKGVLEAGKECIGIPYTSNLDETMGENTSFETFLTAVANPDSVLYTEDISYIGTGSATKYGVACTGFARYCFGIEGKYVTYWWSTIPGMEKIAEKGEWTVEDLELCDIFHKFGDGQHVAVVTDILKDESGKIVEIEVSQATRTRVNRKNYPAETFCESWEKYGVFRYRNTDAVPPVDEEVNKLIASGIDKELPMIAVNYGNKSNYLEGETTVISVFAEGENTVEIIKDGELLEEITFTAISEKGRRKLEKQFEKGYYVVRLKGTDEQAEFCVCKPEISHTTDGKGNITITASSGDVKSKIKYMDFRGVDKFAAEDIYYGDLGGHIDLTEEEKVSGIFTREIPFNCYNYKVYFENEYGIWSHRMIEIDPNADAK